LIIIDTGIVAQFRSAFNFDERPRNCKQNELTLIVEKQHVSVFQPQRRNQPKELRARGKNDQTNVPNLHG
jgi:hypothetical protein